MSIPAAIPRALDALGSRSGRVLAIVGPSGAGKSELLELTRTRLRAAGARTIGLQGSYRQRSVPFAALEKLALEEAGVPAGWGGPGSSDPPADGEDDAIPTTPTVFPYIGPTSGHSLGRGRAPRARTVVFGQVVRGPTTHGARPTDFWGELVREFRASPVAAPVAILAEDASLFDAESRDFLLDLSRRARLRPLLLVFALDNTLSSYMAWEERLLGRGEVDWVRLPGGRPDPRDLPLLREQFEALPPHARRLVGFVALLGGGTGEVSLSRVSGVPLARMREDLTAAEEGGLLRLREGRVEVTRAALASAVGEFLSEEERRAMHLEVAEALAALSPEPALQDRLEIARHYLAWYEGPVALRYLLAAAEMSDLGAAFDQMESLLASALTCVPSLPAREQSAMEAELRLLRARALFYSGRPAEAEAELREGLSAAFAGGLPAERIEEWTESLVPVLSAIGPRTSLVQTIEQLAAGCHARSATGGEVLFHCLLSEHEVEMGRFDASRAHARQAADLARELPDGPVKALAVLAVGLTQIEGSEEDQSRAGRFLQSAQVTLGQSRRYELRYLSEVIVAQLAVARGDRASAAAIHEGSLATVQRMRLLPIELEHWLLASELALDEASVRGLAPALKRAHEIVETLHLLPPASGLLRLWLLEGRRLAIEGDVESARDRWQALVDLPTALGLPRVRLEALARLAMLEFATDHTDEAEGYVRELSDAAAWPAFPPRWKRWLPNIALLAAASRHGGAPLPHEAMTSEAR